MTCFSTLHRHQASELSSNCYACKRPFVEKRLFSRQLRNREGERTEPCSSCGGLPDSVCSFRKPRRAWWLQIKFGDLLDFGYYCCKSPPRSAYLNEIVSIPLLPRSFFYVFLLTPTHMSVYSYKRIRKKKEERIFMAGRTHSKQADIQGYSLTLEIRLLISVVSICSFLAYGTIWNTTANAATIIGSIPSGTNYNCSPNHCYGRDMWPGSITGGATTITVNRMSSGDQFVDNEM